MRKTVFCPYARHEFDRVEGWCEEMERRGLQLLRFRGPFGVFERVEPRRARYRFCAAEAGMDAVFEAERAKYAEFGWELLEGTSVALTEKGSYSLARTADPAAPEMYTDKESFGARASKQLFISAVVLIAINVFWFLRICRTGLTELVEYERRVLPLLILLPLLLCCLIYTALYTQRTSRRLEADALDREYDPKEVRVRYVFLTCEGALIIAAIAALLLLCLA